MAPSAPPLLVVLPSFTGKPLGLEGFLNALGDQAYQLLDLPDSGPQDVDNLVAGLISKLPSEPIILLAESFSCPVAFRLAARSASIIGVIAVNGFLSLSNQAKYPLVKFRDLPNKIGGLWQNYRLEKTLFAGVNSEFKKTLNQAISEMPIQLYRDRCAAMSALPLATPLGDSSIHQPCLVIQGTQDILIDHNLLNDLATKARDIRVVSLAEGHFILQSAPEKAAQVVKSFLEELSRT